MLNGIHEELVELKKLTTPTIDEVDDTATTPVENGNGVGSGGVAKEDEDSWEQVGRKNKSSTMRKV